jgi:hypothetical protein
MKKALLMVAAGLLLASAPVFAHHGDAGRYAEGIVTLTGTVVDMQLVDPHSVIVFDVVDESGKTVRWQAELNGRGGLSKMGWTKNTLKAGDKITLTGRRVKSGAPYMNLTDRANIVLADGKEIFRTENYGTNTPKRPAAAGPPPAN